MGATIGTKLYTWLHGKKVGEDDFGNCYYHLKKVPTDGSRRKRWVVYNGMVEPSKIPALWHAWLHYTIDELPTDMKIAKHDWQKEHVPNLTGTKGAYLPDGHIARGGERAASSSDYEAWTPDNIA